MDDGKMKEKIMEIYKVISNNYDTVPCSIKEKFKDLKITKQLIGNNCTNDEAIKINYATTIYFLFYN